MSDYGLEAEMAALRRERQQEAERSAADYASAVQIAKRNIASFVYAMRTHNISPTPLKFHRRINVRKGILSSKTVTQAITTGHQGWCIYIIPDTTDRAWSEIRTTRAVVVTSHNQVFYVDWLGANHLITSENPEPVVLSDKQAAYTAVSVLANTRRLARVTDDYIRNVEEPWRGLNE